MYHFNITGTNSSFLPSAFYDAAISSSRLKKNTWSLADFIEKTEIEGAKIPHIFIAKHLHQTFLVSIQDISISTTKTSHKVHHKRTSRKATPEFAMQNVHQLFNWWFLGVQVDWQPAYIYNIRILYMIWSIVNYSSWLCFTKLETFKTRWMSTLTIISTL